MKLKNGMRTFKHRIRLQINKAKRVFRNIYLAIKVYRAINRYKKINRELWKFQK